MTRTGFIPSITSAGYFFSGICGCMLLPGDGDHSGMKSRQLLFAGYTDLPHESVRLYAKNALTGQWQEFAKCSTNDERTSLGEGDWYSWSVYSVVPEECWSHKAGDRWSRATIKAMHAEGDLPAFEKGFGMTWSFREFPNAMEAYLKHGSAKSVTIYGL